MDLEEISVWVNPKGFSRFKAEVVYLLEQLDSDGSKDLTLSEALKQPQVFVNSAMTDFGQIYKIKHLQRHIFLGNSTSPYGAP